MSHFSSFLSFLPHTWTNGIGFYINGKRFFKITETRLKIKVIREKGLKAALDLKKRKEGSGN